MPEVPSPPKRARIHLSCSSCRRAKLRCDRNQPCSQCIKRNRQDSCEYASAPARQKPSKSMRSRLHHLESLVINMMNDQVTAHETPAASGAPFSNVENSKAQDIQSTNTEVSDQALNHGDSNSGRVHDTLSESTSSGQVILDTAEIRYIGATHWAAILEDIEEIKSYCHDEPDDVLVIDPTIHTTAMALGTMIVDNRAEILAALPGRAIVDRLVSRYFNSNDPAMIIIHKPTFQRQYQEFWRSPSAMPITWLGLLYAMLCLATLSLLFAGDEPLEIQEPPIDIARRYQLLCSKCLVLENYTSPGIYTVQALLLNFESDFMQGSDINKCWVHHGLLVRVALKMGYHRDARNHPNITPFQGEMQRRMWHMVLQVDLILSFQLGLPSMIRVLQSDTLPPHNLFDDDFGELSLELPPARPDIERTPLSYMICKSRICQAFSMITEQANLIIQPSYVEIMEIDARLHGAYASVPPFLVDRPLNQSITDTPNLIMQRFNIKLLFHKSRCVLHRKYLTNKEANSTYVYSKNCCIDSAFELLHCQSSIQDAVQPGAPLSRDRWFLSTIAAHDFLLGAMILYVYLTNDYKMTPKRNIYSNGKDSEIHGRCRMFKCLQTSYNLWTKSPKEAKDAMKASQILSMMLTNLTRLISPDDEEFIAFTGLQAYSKETFPCSDDYSSTLSTNNQPSQVSWNDLESMIEMPDNLDWESWDGQINAPLSETSNSNWASNMDLEGFLLSSDTEMGEQPDL